MREELLTIFMKRFGWFGFIRILIYPVTTFLTGPVQLVRSLWNCRILVKQKQSDYSHFIPFSGLDALVYWACALNLYKFGRGGICPYIGLGNHRLSRWFHYATSLRFYWKASNITLLAGMFGWLMVHLIWLSHIDAGWLLGVICLAAISTTFYANTFALQNYNVLGWIFFPLGLYGLFTGSWIIAGFAWFLASFGSFTAVFLASVISIVLAIANTTVFPVIALIPAWAKLLTHFYPLVVKREMKVTALNTVKAIGMYRRSEKYRYVLRKKDLLVTIYLSFLYIQFFIFSYLIQGDIPIAFLTGFIIFVANSTYFRFADVQSIHMFMFSLATAHVLQVQDMRLLLSYWLCVSPLPGVMPFPFVPKVLDIVPKASPFFVGEFIRDMEHFLKPVSFHERVLMVFEDPKGEYGKVFDGYRALVQLPLYVASKKEIYLMPDWWAVNDINYQGAPDFWGRSVPEVLINVERWKADYVIIYQIANTKLDDKWEKEGFKVLTKFSWVEHQKDLRGTKPYLGEAPDWWLMRAPQSAV